MTPLMKAAIHLGQDFLDNSEVYKNTKFENIKKEHSECKDPHSHGQDLHCSTTT